MARRSSGGKPRSMTAKEEQAWRAFVRAMLVVPRVLEADLLESSRLNFAEYHVLAYLSEQPGHAMRMSQLSELGALSPSGMTRVVERLTRQGLVKRCRSEDDGRGQVAALTDAGFERLKAAWPDHLASARSRVMDHLADLDLDVLTRALNAMNEASERDATRKR